MTELVIARGLPGSGKTTWAKEWEALDPHHRVRVNRDDTRERLFGSANQDYYACPKDELHAKESLVTEANVHAISAALKAGFSVAVDDTNLPVKRCRDLARLAVAAGVEWRVAVFGTPLDVCLERNALREDKEAVPEATIRDMWNRYVRGGLMPVPEDLGQATDYSEVVSVERNESLPPAFIFDIDGTLAHMTGRSPYDYSRVSEDTVDEDVADMARLVYNEWDAYVFVVSGRKAECREATEDWLRENNIPYDKLFMRADGDERADWKVKYDLFNENIRGKYDVRGVFDDRNQVVKMWRALGLKCFQCAEGDF